MAKLYVIGSGDAFGTAGRFQTSFWLEFEGLNVLVDCGANAPLNLKRLGKSIRDIDIIFITHFHGDHFGGLPFILTELAFDVEETHKIHIIGPIGIENRTLALQEAMYSGSTKYILPITNFREYDKVNSIGGLKVEAYPMMHSENSNPHGIRIEKGGHSFAYSGDGEWCDSHEKLAEGSNLMIIECYDYDKQTPGHLNYNTISRNREKLNSDKLYLTHLGPEMINKKLDIPALEDGMELEF